MRNGRSKLHEVGPNRRRTTFEDIPDQYEPVQMLDREIVTREVVAVRNSPRRPVPISPREVDFYANYRPKLPFLSTVSLRTDRIILVESSNF